MKGNLAFIIIISLLYIALDLYVFQAIRLVSQNLSPALKKTIFICFWGFSLIIIGSFYTYNLGIASPWSRVAKSAFLSIQTFNFIPKLFIVIFLLLDDIQRSLRWIATKVSWIFNRPEAIEQIDIPRSEFLIKSGIILATLPLVTISYGITKGVHDYKIRRVKLPLKNLPSAFHGLRIAQISDIHAGSFYSKTAVLGGVEMLLKEKPDMVFFTGDLVNNTANEIHGYFDVFSKVKAPLGVYSTLGNHDYGEYVAWSGREAKAQNLKDMREAHRLMGWQLLDNTNRLITQSGDQLAIVGVENWGAGSNWPKYGKLNEALKGTSDAAVKLLLSHDPSHWDAQVRPMFPEVDVTFSGHTHGFQFGIEIGDFKWSPSQYIYKQWAGLYQQKDQYLYVNRGYGFLGFPGRVGMPPEITLFELEKA
jgi:predicted MPP superfamily phosphohydrolase